CKLKCLADCFHAGRDAGFTGEVASALDVYVRVMIAQCAPNQSPHGCHAHSLWIVHDRAELRYRHLQKVFKLAKSIHRERKCICLIAHLQGDRSAIWVRHYGSVPQTSAPDTATVMVAVMRSSI